MDQKPIASATPGLKLSDILYIVFRQKWLISLIASAGLIAALALPFLVKPKYESDAKLLIKYIVEAKSPPQVGTPQSTVQQVEDSGANVLNTELEILTSPDLALQVADVVGPDKILEKMGGGNDRYAAAGVIQDSKNLNVEVLKKSSVIRLSFQHRVPAVAQAVMVQLINSYTNRHAQIHLHSGIEETLTQETDQLHSQLLQTEEALRKAKIELGVISLDDEKKVCAEQIARLQQKVFDAEAELAEREAEAKELGSLGGRDLGRTNLASTNLLAATNVVASEEKVTEYKKICGLLDSLGRREQELLAYLTPVSPLAASVHEQILRNQKIKGRLEEENPNLKTLGLSTAKTGFGDAAFGVRADPTAAITEAAGLRSKIQVLTNRLAEVQKRAAALEAAESNISELQRKRNQQEGYFTNFSATLDASRINERLGAGKVSNIIYIQEPSAPWKVRSKLRKLMAMVLFGSVAGAFSLAFLIELFLDQSLRRAADVEAKLGLPLFITVPILRFANRLPALGNRAEPSLLTEHAGENAAVKGRQMVKSFGQSMNGTDADSATLDIPPWDPSHGLRPFSEALRDRLITHFEIENLTHKPKLVAVTSCAEGSGVSSIAAGLAAALSETGEGNVLLVDMKIQNGAAHHFQHGDLACGIDDALELGKRNEALVQQNLYVVSESANGEKLPSVLPQRFRNLVPRLKASDYDYIIFDMPPVTQVSLTPRLAKFMDMVLMVVESGKTDREIAKKACSLLTASRARVGIVLNKARNYVPKRLQQEL